jgi:hypothetical protein
MSSRKRYLGNVPADTSPALVKATVFVPVGIATQPASTTINSGQSATLSVVAAGSGPFSYQWYDGTSGVTTTPVGTNSSSFTTPALSATKSYWVRVTSTCNGTAGVNSNTATVTVQPPQITRRQAAFALAQSQTGITATWTQPTQAGTLLVAVISSDVDTSVLDKTADDANGANNGSIDTGFTVATAQP